MFDGLLGRKFYTKCKSSIKTTKVRIEAIRKKRNAMQKYLRNDIADLLRNGLDTNAYGRLNKTLLGTQFRLPSMVHMFLGCMSTHPKLYVDQTLAEGLLNELNLSSCYDFIEQFCGCISSHLSAMDKQRECPEECREAVASLMYAAARFADLPELRDLRNIFTQRYGNSLEAFVNKEFVEKLRSKPPTKDMKLQLMQYIAQESSIEWDSKALEQKLYNPPQPRKDWTKNGSLNDTNDDGYKWNKSTDDAVPKIYNQDAVNKVSNAREYNASRKNEEDLSSHRWKKVAEKEKEDLPSHERRGLNPGKDIREASIDQDVPQEEADNRKPFYNKIIPPPYVKPKASKYGTSSETLPVVSDCNEAPTDIQTRSDRDSVGEANKPKPRSVRRRNLKPPPGHDNVGSFESGGVAKMNSTLCTDDHDRKDEDEGIMDGLLIHYSSKPSPYEPGKIKANLKPPPSDTGKHPKSELVAPPARAISLPPEPTTPTEVAKGPPRATSFQPDMMNPAGHVHPKLPDYDDLAARFAALRGR